MGKASSKSLKSLRGKLDRPESWLAGPGARGFAAALAQARRKISTAKKTGKFRRGPVVVAEAVRAKFLAGVFAAIEREIPVALASPQWGEAERRQAAAQIHAGLWLGENTPRWPKSKAAKFAAKKWRGAILVPTGGTGGRVRWAVHTWATLAAAARAFAKFFDAAGCTHVSTLPPWHVGGLMPAVRALETGGVLWLEDWKSLEAGEPPVTPAGCAIVSLVPTQLSRLLRRPRVVKWLRGTRAILLGGAAPSSALLKHARRLRLPVALAYGMTETAAVVAAQTPADFLAGAPPRATPLPRAKIWVGGESGQRPPTGKKGRIWIAADALFSGYYPTRRKPGPFATADFGVMDKRGRLSPKGRLDNVIITGGEKVDPAAVEMAIRKTKWVRDVRVIGLPDAEWGERVAAIYTGPRKPDVKLRNSLQGKLAAHAVPKIWIHARQLPGGKRLG